MLVLSASKTCTLSTETYAGSEIISICQIISCMAVNCLSGGRNTVENFSFSLLVKVCPDQQQETKFSALEVYFQRLL